MSQMQNSNLHLHPTQKDYTGFSRSVQIIMSRCLHNGTRILQKWQHTTAHARKHDKHIII